MQKKNEVEMRQVKKYQTVWAKRVDDEVLTQFWDRLCVSGIARMTFYECMPKNSEAFCLWVKGKSQDVRLILDEKSESDNGAKILAIYWLNNPLGKAAMIHFCFTREAFLEQREIGEYVVRSLLLTKNEEGDFVLSALMGVTPKVYRHALRFIEELGFSILGVLPKSCFFFEKKSHRDGVISVLTRENIMRKHT